MTSLLTLSNTPLASWYGPFPKLYKGLIGLEFEVEGDNIVPWTSPYWKVDEDGSLRNGLEYILRHPVSLKSIPKVLDEFYNRHNEHGAVFRESIRTSIHVHINVQQRTFLEIYNIITAYWLLEKLLVRYCGHLREGNLFCLRVSDADFLTTRIVESINDRTFFSSFSGNDFKYSALRLQTLTSIGSLEFRSLRGCYNEPDRIKEWITAIVSLVDQASKFESPQDILNNFNLVSANEFIYHFFNEEFAQHLIASSPNPQQDLEDHFHYAFQLATAIPNWSNYSITHNKTPTPPSSLWTQVIPTAEALTITLNPTLGHNWVTSSEEDDD